MQVLGVKPKTYEVLSDCLSKFDMSRSNEFYEFGMKTGRLKIATIMQMVNGVSLEKFGTEELWALFDFLNDGCKLGSIKDYFVVRDYVKPFTNRKEEYLRTVESKSSRRSEKSRLKKITESVEPYFLKDLCELSYEEIVAGLSNVRYPNRRELGNGLSVLRRYINWCYDQGYYAPAKRSIDKVKTKDIPTLK